MKLSQSTPAKYTPAKKEKTPSQANSDESSRNIYYPVSRYYKEKFGEKVYKISVSLAKTCPNRQDPEKGPCVFCDQWGSAARPEMANLPLEEQIRISKDRLARRFKVKKFLVYFQSFTSAYIDMKELEKNIEISLSADQVCGVVIGNRPDHLPPEIFPMLKRFNEQAYVSMELGAQSFFDRHLEFLRRGHNSEQTVNAVKQLWERSGVDVCLHLIFGLPGETDEQIIQTAEIINQLPVRSVKPHNLHVLEGASLADLYRRGLFKPVGLDEYAQKIALFLERLSPNIATQRLAALAGSWNKLMAPEWCRDRFRPIQAILDRMKEKNSYQGIHFS